MPQAITGFDCDLFYNTGNTNTPTWTAIDAVRDETVNGKWDVAEAMTRGSRVKTGVKTAIDASVSGAIQVSYTDAAYLALRAAFVSPTATVDIMVLNGSATTNGATGFRYDAQVTDWTEDRGAQNALYANFTLTPTLANPPKTVVVTAGSPAFTNL